jgi:hypothetical protein
VVEVVYADVAPSLWPAAELSVRAQIAHITETSADDQAQDNQA